jgi:hypothetical protein
MDQHPLPRPDRVRVQREAVDPVLQLILNADRPPGQLARLARGRKAAAKPVRERATQMKPRASAPTTSSGRRGAAQAVNPSTAARSAIASASKGITSRKTTPSRGKSGISRTSPRSCCSASTLIERNPIRGARSR